MIGSASFLPHLIRTKLHRPTVTPELVRRPRLFDTLHAGYKSPLTLVSAPAGSGKTTLLSTWLDECRCHHAWVSLDEGDADLLVFLHYFVAAIRSIYPNFCAEIEGVLEALDPPPPHVITPLLINALNALAANTRFILVLDDYHLVRGQAVNIFLTELLRRPPSVMHLVIATRSEPALPLPTLRARGQLTEVRNQDMRFTAEETAVFLQNALQSEVSADLAVSLEDYTEGWVAGLHLAALSLRNEPDPARLMGKLEKSDRYIMDFLVDEALSQQPPPVQQFLLKTSILNRLCGPLCEAAMGADDDVWDGQSCLEYIERENLFVVAMDGQGRWFRYHHLFQRLLQNRLLRQYGPDAIAALHTRASTWLAAAGLIEEAVAHAFAAGDETLAVQIVDAQRHLAMNQERWQQLERLLNMMPRRLIEERIELLLLEVWCLQQRWRFADIPARLDRIDVLLEQTPLTEPKRTHLLSEVDALRSLLAYYVHADERAYAHAVASLQSTPPEHSAVRGVAWMYYAGSLQLKGEMARAREAFLDGLKEDALHGNAFPSRLLIGLCIFNWLVGDLPDMARTATYFLELATARNLHESKLWAHYLRGCARYQQNDLVGAEQDFAAVVAQRYVAHSHPYSQAVYGLAAVYMAHGAFEQAQALMDSLLSYALEIQNTRIHHDARSFLAYLALRQGRMPDALRSARECDLNQPLPPLVTFHIASLSLAKVLLASESSADRQDAALVLGRLEALARTTHSTRCLIEVLALQALLHEQMGDRQAALAAMECSVMLAQVGGIARVYVDLGAEVIPLLSALHQRDVAASFIDLLLKSIAGHGRSIEVSSVGRFGPVEPLTRREMEVLELLAQRRTNKEIASTLFITEGTVMRHTANIYRKLGVTSRGDAVMAASLAGILSPGVQ